MTDIDPILRVVPTLQAVALLQKNLKFVKKKKKRASDFANVAAGNIVGTALIQEESNFINGM